MSASLQMVLCVSFREAQVSGAYRGELKEERDGSRA